MDRSREANGELVSPCEDSPENTTPAQQLHEKVFSLISSGDYRKAEEFLKEILALNPDFYGTYRTLGEILPRYCQSDSIQGFLHTLAEEHPRNGYAYWALGLYSLSHKSYENADTFFRQAVSSSPHFFEAYESLVDMYGMQGKLHGAAPGLDSFFRSIYNNGTSDAAYGLAYLAYRQGNINDAFRHSQSLLSGSVSATPGRLYKLTGTLSSIRRQTRTAAGYYECALNAFRASGDKQGEMAAFINLGIVCDQLLEYEKALEKYKQALALIQSIRDDTSRGLVLMNMGITCTHLDEYNQSFVYLHQARAHFSGMDVPPKNLLMYIYNNLGRLHDSLSDYSRARDYYYKALLLSRETGRRDEEIVILNNLGDVYKREHDDVKALDMYRQALALVGEDRNPWMKAVILNNTGELYVNIGNMKQAMDAFQRSLDYRRQTADRRGEGITLKNIGYLHYVKGEYREAIGDYREALRLAGKDAVEGAEITGETGICFHALKQDGKALDYLKKSIEATEMIRNRLAYEKHKTGFMQNKRRVYNAVIDILYKREQEIGKRADQYSAFEYSEKAKAVTLLDLLKENRISLEKGIPPGLKTRIHDIEREYNLKSTQLQEELKKSPVNKDPGLIGKLEKHLNNLERDYEDVYIRAAIENPGYEQLVPSEPVSPSRIRELLPDTSTFLISYHVTDNALFIWGIGKDTYKCVRQSLKQGTLRENVLYAHHLLSKPSHHDDYLDVLSQLYTLLIEPVLVPGSHYARLIIIPDGVLHYLPFEVLVSSAGKTGDIPPYLVREYSIQYVQSATILSYLYTRKNGRPSPGMTRGDALLAVGDPAFTPSDSTIPFTGSHPGFLFSLADVKSLPHSGREVREIGKLFDKKLLLCGADAREERIKTPGALDDYACIHFATHSIISGENSQRSGLVLAQDSDPEEDGFLQVREIFHLETRADMVVLSACKTKLGEYREGEGLLGFTRAWMYAGASSVIASLWSIHDESSSRFMISFYRHLKEGMSPADALRKTRLLFMEQGPSRHPYFWAGFVLTGKG